MPEQTLWLIGDYDHAEFAAPVAWLRERGRCLEFAQPQELLDLVRPAPVPQAIIFLTARPGRISARDVEWLHRREPLATLLAVLGSFCEGELRSGRPWPGVTRLYWHQWANRLPRLLDPAGQRLPRTATDVDVAQAPLQAASAGDGCLIAICATRYTAYEALADACALAGYRSFWQLPHLPLQARGVDLILCDGDWKMPCVTENADIPRVAILDFPRLADQQRALAAGFAAVMARPFLLADLMGAMQSILLPLSQNG